MPPKDVSVADDDKKAPADKQEQAGPRLGSKGEYLPATYKTKKGNIREDR